MDTPALEKKPGDERICGAQGVLNDKQGSCIEVHVAGTRAVQYEIHFDRDMNPMPYAFDWNGTKQPQNRMVTGATNSHHVLTINAVAYPGQTVGIYLGSDALPEYRQELLYPVKVGKNDIKVIIQTRPGLHADPAELGEPVRTVATAHGDHCDEYEASLTGKTWMRFSHRYTAQEATAFASQAGEADSGLLAGLHQLYGGGVRIDQATTVSFAGQHGCAITFQHGPQGSDANLQQNVAGYSSAAHFGSECLPRVHPVAWLGLLQAARDSGITAIEISSGWRPLTGAANHRMGVGLDVKNIRDAQGRRVVFDVAQPKALWSSEEEKQAHARWVESIAPDEAAQRELQLATAHAKRFGQVWNEENQEYEYNGKPGWEKARDRFDETKAKANRTSGARTGAKDEFYDKRRGTLADRFEQCLLKNAELVRQVFSPVIIEADTKSEEGKNRLAPNGLRKGNSLETSHGNHLHITARHKDLRP